LYYPLNKKQVLFRIFLKSTHFKTGMADSQKKKFPLQNLFLSAFFLDNAVFTAAISKD